MICIKNGILHTAITKDIFVADLLIDHGKIVKIGKNISAENAEEINASGYHVYPGFIDAHCHIGLDGYGIGYEGQDYNELNDLSLHRYRSSMASTPLIRVSTTHDLKVMGL